MGLIKTERQLDDIKIAGKRLATVFKLVKDLVNISVSLEEIDNAVAQKIKDLDCKASFLNYEGYPKSSCISVNEQVIHAIPNDYKLKDGDILTVDIGLWYKKVCVDGAHTYFIGKVDKRVEDLIIYTNEALMEGIKKAKAGNHVGAISQAIESVAVQHNLGIVRNYTGHGVGLAVHEKPSIPNIGKNGDGMILKPGMVLAIEPMFTLGGGEVITLPDGWTVVTADNSMAAQFEHTIIITNGNPIITTK